MLGAKESAGLSHRDKNAPVPFVRSGWADKKRQRIRILVADEHPIVRYGLRMLLQAEVDLRIVGEAGNCAEAGRLVNKLRPDLLLVDLAREGSFGAEALHQIAGSHPDLRIILLLTVDAERQQIINALKMGVHGVVMKRAPLETFAKSIRMVMAGEYWIPRSNIPDLIRALQGERPEPSTKQRPLNLTARELEIVRAVAAGYTNKDVAQRFSISEDTVKHHLTSVFDKLGVSNRLELAILAIGRGLVPPA